MAVSKVKVSLTLAADLVATIDREARRTRTTRSGLIEEYLRASASRAAERSIEVATVAYYESLWWGGWLFRCVGAGGRGAWWGRSGAAPRRLPSGSAMT
jgi:hypothetical protein